MSKYRLYLNDVYDGEHHHVDHDGVARLVDEEDVFKAMEIALKVARECGAKSYRLMEGDKAGYKLTAAYASWYN
jgi:hypothetical protein